MKRLVEGYGEIGKERNIEVFMELAVTYFGLEGLFSFHIGRFGRPPYFYSVCPHWL
jgi:hypothetical protein